MKKAAQIGRHEPAGRYRRELKKRVTRARRRAEKRDPLNAPGRLREFTVGWST